MRLIFNDYQPNEVVKIIREWTELNQTEFGKRIGKSLRTIQDYESGKTKYNSITLKKICKEFRIEINIEIIFQKK